MEIANNNRLNGLFKTLLQTAASVTLCLPVVLHAQAFTGQAEIGIGYNSEDSFKFGEYTGLEDEGAFFIGNLRIKNIIDSGSNDYWELNGVNLGLDSRSIYGEYVQQGKFEAFLSYDQLPHFRFEDGSTPFLGAGTTTQTLPADWVAANTTGGLTNLLSDLQTFEVGTEREKFGGGFSWMISDKWEFSGEYSHEIKNGHESLGAIFGTNGGNPRGAILIHPIDYAMDEYNLALSYTNRQYQFSLNYFYSQFENDAKSLAWDNPFLRLPFGNTWAPGTDFAAGVQGQLALVPDNQAQQLNFAGAYRFGKNSRLTANISWGQMEQDDAFLPYTVNPNLIVTAPLPRNNLDGEIDTLYMKLGFTTRPMRKLDIRANYIYDERDNNTPRDIFQIVHNESGNQGTLLSSSARVNTPYSFETHKFQIDVGYRLPAMSKLTVGYEYEQRDRDFLEVTSTDEHTVNLKLWSSFNAMFNGWIKYTHSQRDGAGYVSNQPFLDAHNPDYTATLAADELHINDPLLRKYTYANRDRDQISGTLNIIPSDPLVLSITANYAMNDYDDSLLGLQESDDYSITFDGAYTVSKDLSAYAFFTHEAMEYQQAGYQRFATDLFPGIVRDPPPCPTCGFWNADTDDETNTFGAGIDWTVIENKLDVKFDYTYSRSVTAFGFNGDSNITFGPLPDVESSLHGINLTGNYQLNDKTSLRLRYLYERLDLDDFALDGVGVDTLSNVISLGNANPNYNAHVVGLSVIYDF